MAKLLRGGRPAEHCGTHRHQLRHESYRGALCPLRRALRPCISGWSRANWIALLHELSIARLQAEEVSGRITTEKRKTMERGLVGQALHRFCFNSTLYV